MEQGMSECLSVRFLCAVLLTDDFHERYEEGVVAEVSETRRVSRR